MRAVIRARRSLFQPQRFLTRLIAIFGLAAGALLPRLAFAQDPYVGVSLVGNSVRTSSMTEGFGDGTSAGVSARVGTTIGAEWGLDAEVVYPGAITFEYQNPFVAFGETTSPLPSDLSFVPPTYTQSIRHGTFSTMVWVRLSAGESGDDLLLCRSSAGHRRTDPNHVACRGVAGDATDALQGSPDRTPVRRAALDLLTALRRA